MTVYATGLLVAGRLGEAVDMGSSAPGLTVVPAVER
jgi:hypothetical protein